MSDPGAQKKETHFLNDQAQPVTFVGPTAEEKADDRDECQRLEVVAQLCWATHCAWEDIIGEAYVTRWGDLSQEQRDEVAANVRWLAEHPTASVAAQHDAWRARKVLVEPDHPNLKPFDDLPFSQQVKARLWRHTMFAVMG